MTLPVSPNSISMSQVNTELGLSSTGSINIGASNVRTLFGKASGAIAMSDGYGKSNRAVISYTYAANTANASLNVAALGGYVAGKSDITITINSGIYLYSTSTATPGLTLSGGAAGDTVTVVNNGYIMGMGGNGGGYSGSVYGPGAGGSAISLGVSASIINNSYIGGGGGGGARSTQYVRDMGGGGGGAGGGAGGAGNGVAGGAGGGLGARGDDGALYYVGKSQGGCGGGGGRVMPGTGGTGGSDRGYGGTAGGGGGTYGFVGFGGAGGSGGSAGSNGSASYAAGGGGGWGASGGSAGNGAGGAAGGKAIALNGFTATRTGSGTTYGAVS